MSQQLLDPLGPLKVFGVGIAIFGKWIPVIATALVVAWVLFWPSSDPNLQNERLRDQTNSVSVAQWCADLRAAQDYPLPDDCS